MLLVYLCFSSGVYLYFRILMYVKRHEQFQIGCGPILNKKYIIKPHCQPRYTPSRNLSNTRDKISSNKKILFAVNFRTCAFISSQNKTDLCFTYSETCQYEDVPKGYFIMCHCNNVPVILQQLFLL